MAVASQYLLEQFAKFPEILQQVDEAVHTYINFLDQYQEKIRDTEIWRFNYKLRSAIFAAAKESKTFALEINVKDICSEAGIIAEVAELMPLLKIQGVNVELEVKPHTSLMLASWGKSGLISSTIAKPLEELQTKKTGLSYCKSYVCICMLEDK